MRAAVLMVALAWGCAGAERRPFLDFFPKPPALQATAAAGKPLFLTPYIKSGRLAEARRLSSVTGLQTDVASHSGFLTVDERHNSNLFFWYFPAQYNAAAAPLVLWLQGGPGGSSLFGLFVENGPFAVDAQLRLVPRNHSWHQLHNMLYIDNPVGTGFSFTDSDAGYVNNEEEVARDLYEALRQFFTLFAENQQRAFFVSGESYAGKYVPAIAYKIHTENQRQKMKIPLKGLAIGDGLCDPVYQLNYGDFLYNVGLIDSTYRDRFRRIQRLTTESIRKGDLHSAFVYFSSAMDVYTEATGLSFVYNILLQQQPREFDYYTRFVVAEGTRRAIHVGGRTYNDGVLVYKHLTDDIMRTVRDKIVALLDNDYKVMIYNGQMDVIIDYIGTENLVAHLPWKGREAFNGAPRRVWRVGGEVAGYVRQTGTLTQVMVRNAGHILPFDQPAWAFDLITHFTHGKALV